MVGGVAAIAIALLISIWYFRKRKSKAQSAQSAKDDLGDSTRSYYGKDAPTPVLYANPYEKDATSRAPYVNEADSVAKHELLVGTGPTPAMELQDTSK